MKKASTYGICRILIILTLSSLLFGQKIHATDTLHVTSNITPVELVQQVLIGGGIFSSNITYTGADISRGKFWGGPGNVGIRDGVLLTSGSVNIALGPNNSGGAGQSVNLPGDPDLTMIANVTTYDACVLEFDFIPQSKVVSFRYVFASEEYHEYIDQYNDAFGFFISGPGISGPYSNNSKNIALIPLTNIPVSINTVNAGNPYGSACDNCQFFVNNVQNFTQYDAFTTVLTAWANVVPCETYHIKLAIGDGADHVYDSGVFLEAGSFVSIGIGTEIEYTQAPYVDFAIEGCSDAAITFTLSDQPDDDFYLPITIAGTATNGVDYVEIPDSICFPAGYSQVDVDITTIPDGLSEWMETIFLIYNSSLCSVDYDTAKINLWDYTNLYINTTPDTTINCATLATIGITDLGGFAPYNIVWSNGDTTEMITVSPLITTTYYVTVIALCDTVNSDSITVFVNGPEANAGPDKSVPYGTPAVLDGSVSQGSGNYTYHWEPAGLLVDPDVLIPTTVLMDQTVLFTLIVTDLAGGCQDYDQVVVFVTGGPLGVNPVADPQEICFGGASQITSYASGGSENYTYTWTSNPPGFTSDIPNPVVMPLATTTYQLLVSDGYNVVNGNVTVTVLPLPIPDAGADITIPNGAWTNLSGNATLGTGDYSWFWEPTDKLLNPNAQNPTTTKLYETTLFKLHIIDNITGCESEGQDLVTVFINGGLLSVVAEVTDSLICAGETTQLHALPGGGNFPHYTYVWTSNPSGFSSNESDPFISPLINTIYTVRVYDEYNYIDDNVQVDVSPLPMVNLGADIIACPYDSVTINAGFTGMNHYWSNGSTNQSITIGTTGIGFDIKKFWVNVTNEDGCVGTDTIQVLFDFSQCFGIGENTNNLSFRLYPNPTDGVLNLELQGQPGEVYYEITNLQGMLISSRTISIPDEGFLKESVSMSGNSKGIYLIKLKNDQQFAVGKIILK